MKDEREENVRRSFRDQAALCKSFGSPFTAKLLIAAADVLDFSTSTGRRILNWDGPPDANGDALGLRLAGGLHALSRTGDVEELSDLYPPLTPESDEEFQSSLITIIKNYDERIEPWLDFPPQTNEVGRSAILYLGLKEIAKETGLDLSLFEIGSSAGLNLVLDRHEYVFGEEHFGCIGSALRLSPNWKGKVPMGPCPRVVARRGCDVAPLYMSKPSDRHRLQAYIWPDQLERHKRLETAIDIFCTETSISIDKADAPDWVEENLCRQLSFVTVLMHSLTYCYLDDKSKHRIRNHMESIGSCATSDSPVAWLAFEMDELSKTQLTLRIWPTGKETVLAVADPHCRSIEWVA
ncbi:MAG: DUF2332 domain-containing protein [Gammaproteobacteria bacterium]|nr:DUF2332 domain-containing protein [Gammaproteobacteria bacterium]